MNHPDHCYFLFEARLLVVVAEAAAVEAELEAAARN